MRGASVRATRRHNRGEAEDGDDGVRLPDGDCKELKANELGSTFKQVVSKKENLETLGGISEASSEGTTHSVRLEEQLAFSDWINTNLSHDPDLKHLLPIDPEGKTLYEKVKDGILLWYAFILLFLFVDRLLY